MSCCRSIGNVRCVRGNGPINRRYRPFPAEFPDRPRFRLTASLAHPARGGTMSFTGVHRMFGRVTRAIAVSAVLALALNSIVALPARAAPKTNAPEAAQRYDDVPGGTVAVQP